MKGYGRRIPHDDPLRPELMRRYTSAWGEPLITGRSGRSCASPSARKRTSRPSRARGSAGRGRARARSRPGDSRRGRARRAGRGRRCRRWSRPPSRGRRRGSSRGGCGGRSGFRGRRRRGRGGRGRRGSGCIRRGIAVSGGVGCRGGGGVAHMLLNRRAFWLMAFRWSTRPSPLSKRS